MGALILGVSGCPAIVGDMLCGLRWRHAGEHVPFVPGDYLPPPILHLLDLLLFSTSCPLCKKWAMPPDGELVTAFRGGPENWDRARPEWQWAFQPCGCMGRILLD